jgi:hypothetical protein
VSVTVYVIVPVTVTGSAEDITSQPAGPTPMFTKISPLKSAPLVPAVLYPVPRRVLGSTSPRVSDELGAQVPKSSALSQSVVKSDVSALTTLGRRERCELRVQSVRSHGVHVAAPVADVNGLGGFDVGLPRSCN